MTPKAIAEALEQEVGIDGPPRPLKLAIEDILYRRGTSRIDATVVAERLWVQVASVVASRAAISEAAGIVAPLVLLGSMNDHVAGFAHALPSDSVEVARAKRHRRHVDALLDAMKGLTFNEFEKFGARILVLSRHSELPLRVRQGPRKGPA